MIKIDKTSRIMINSNTTIQRKSAVRIKHDQLRRLLKQ